MVFKRAVLCLLLCLVTFAVSAEYRIDQIRGDEILLWKTMTGREAGQELVQFRQRNDPEGFAARFVLFLNQGRTTSEILAMLRVIGLPLKNNEMDAMLEILLDQPVAVFEQNMLENGYSLECHGTPGTRFSLVFLNEAERSAWKKLQEEGREGLSEHETSVVDNLEGRLCVWAVKRKIHLGGPHLTFERVKPILIYADKELD